MYNELCYKCHKSIINFDGVYGYYANGKKYYACPDCHDQINNEVKQFIIDHDESLTDWFDSNKTDEVKRKKYIKLLDLYFAQ